jgi:hypothetical protein
MNSTGGNKMKNEPTKPTLVQIDYYGVLSPTVKLPKDEPERDEDIAEDTPQYDDLWLRAQLHGYSAEIDPNTVVHALESEPIPLKTIRVPLKPGLSSSWAPNGYGKTYIFSHLDRLKTWKQKEGDAPPLALLQTGWLSGTQQLASDYPQNETELVPYHALGLRVQENDTLTSLIWIPKLGQDGFYMARQDRDSIHHLEANNSRSGWAYVPDAVWEQKFPFEKSEKAEDFIQAESTDLTREPNPDFLEALNIINMYTSLEVVYHETPSHSEKKDFEEDFLPRVVPLLKEHGLVHRSGWGLSHKDGTSQEEPYLHMSISDSLGSQLGHIRDFLMIYRDPSTIYSSLWDDAEASAALGQMIETFETFVGNKDAAHPLPQWTEPVNFDVLFHCMLNLSEILFSVGLYRKNVGFNFISKLYSAMAVPVHSGNHTHPLFELLDAYLMEYALLTDAEIPDRPELSHGVSNYLHYRTVSVARRMSFQRQEKGMSPDLSPSIARRLSEVPGFSEEGVELDGIGNERFQAAAWDLVRDGFESVSLDYLEKVGTLTPILSVPWFWPLLCDESVALDDLPEDRREDFKTLFNDLSHRWMTHPENAYVGHMGGDIPDRLFFPSLFAQPINLQFLKEEIDMCLLPNEMEDTAWAIQVSVDADHGLEFHPYKLKENTVHARHLSFGIRSELTAQLGIQEFLLNHRSSMASGQENFHLFILDEPEIGRSEEWTEKLINRLQRLGVQMMEASSAGVLLVSHRSKVARRASPYGSYMLMQKVPKRVLDEDLDFDE